MEKAFGLSQLKFYALTLSPLTWRIWRDPSNASIWQMGFNSAFKEVIYDECSNYSPTKFCKNFFGPSTQQ
jgi:hypothetical protein